MKALTRIALVLATVPLCGAAPSQETPSRFASPVEQRETPPLWISAESVADPEEGIDREILDSPHLRNLIEKQRPAAESRVHREEIQGEPRVQAIPRSECVRMSALEDDRGGWAPVSSLADMAGRSRSILRGTIRKVTPGFYKGIPDALLTVDVQEAVKGSAPAATIHIDYQVAHFRIGAYRFCTALNGYEPSPGDSILLVDYTGPIDQNRLLFAPRLEQILFERRDGGLALRPQAEYFPEIGETETLDLLAARFLSARS